MEKTNLFIELLRCLNVKYTVQYASNLYEGHPYRDSLYGLSDMLFIYNIENTAIKLENKNQISNLDFPFIAYINNVFVLVKQINNGNIEFLWKNDTIQVSIKEFISVWSGVALIANTNKKSIEPNFKENKKKELINKGLNVCLGTFLFLFCSYSFFLSGLWKKGIGFIGLELVLGSYICYLLLEKQLNVESVYAEKLCSLFKKNGCNDVLNSEASKFWGIFSWSEIGFSYFISGLLIFLFFPSWILYCAWINILVLPYSIWSIWYQGYRLKQWCPMCMMIIGLLWVIFFSYNLTMEIIVTEFNYIDFFITMCLYMFVFLIIYKGISLLSGNLLKKHIENEMNRIKLNENVFLSLLTNNSYCPPSFNSSKILLGNRKSKKIVTIFTNPHCEPCSKMHKKIDALLDEGKNDYAIQYIFTSFDPSLDVSCKMLISAYLYNKDSKIRAIYNEWFKSGKYNKEHFFNKYNLKIDSYVEEEFDKHKEWKKKNNFNETPTVLINGYMLPTQYNIEDLRFVYKY